MKVQGNTAFLSCAPVCLACPLQKSGAAFAAISLRHHPRLRSATPWQPRDDDPQEEELGVQWCGLIDSNRIGRCPLDHLLPYIESSQ